MESHGLPWFTTKGQITDLALKILLAILAGANAWPQMKQNEFLSAGALVFYGLVALVLAALGMVLNAIRKARRNPAHTVGGDEIANAPHDFLKRETTLLSTTDFQVWVKAQGEFQALSWQHKVLLREIYRQPGKSWGEYLKALEAMGLANPLKLLQFIVEETSLAVVNRTTLIVDRASNSKIANRIEGLIERTPL